MGRKRVIIVLIIIASIWVGNISYYLSQQIDEPIFMKHYYEERVSGEYNIKLLYLVNKNRDIDVSWIEIPGISNSRFNINEFPRQRFNHQDLNQITITISEKDLEVPLGTEEFIIDEVVVYYTNGKNKKVNIGEIRINKYEHKNDKLITWNSSGSSSNNTGYSMLNINRDMKIIDINTPLLNRLKEFFQVYIDEDQNKLSNLSEKQKRMEEGKEDSAYSHRENNDMFFNLDGIVLDDIKFPLKLNKGDKLKLNYSFSPKNDNDRSYNYYILNMTITGETSEGIKFNENIRMDYEPYFSNSDIRKIVKERR